MICLSNTTIMPPTTISNTSRPSLPNPSYISPSSPAASAIPTMAAASIIINAIKAPGIRLSRYESIITIPAKAPQAYTSISRKVGWASSSTWELPTNSSTVATPVKLSTRKATAAESANAR